MESSNFIGIGDDATLLETMLPYFIKPDKPPSPESDLIHILGKADEFNEDTTENLSDTKADEFAVRVLFSRNVSNCLGKNSSKKYVPSLKSACEKIEKDYGENPRNINRCPFIQTRNENYRTVMEELMLIKYISSTILESLEDTKVILDQCVEVKNDPGFGRIHVTQAWIWILKEAVASLISTDDDTSQKSLHPYLENLLLDVQKPFTQLLLDITNLTKSFDSVWREFENLMDLAMSRFKNNLENALEYERKTSGYNFFCNWKPSVDSLDGSSTAIKADICDTIDRKCSDNSQKQSLHVRCSVDGVTLHTEKMGTSWLKFQRIRQEKDKMLLLRVFILKIQEFCTNVRESMALVNALLVHKFIPSSVSSSQSNNDLNESIQHSIIKCQEILDIPPTQVTFFPKEEVALIYSLKTTKAALKLIKPLLTEFTMSAEMQFTIVREFTKQKKQLKSGHIYNRFPKLLNSRFQLFIDDTKANTDIILNRYPNIIEARKMREKLLQKQSCNVDVLSESYITLDGAPVETLYLCPLEKFFTPSTQEIIDMFRKLISQQQSVINPNPAYYLFSDVTQDYVRLTKELTTSRTITPEILSFCSDPIRNFHKEAIELSSFKDQMLAQIVYATQKLTYTKSGNDVARLKRARPLSSWIQVVCKILHVWDFHSLPKALQNHFREANVMTMKWTAKLEDSLRKISERVNQYKVEFNQFQDSIQTKHVFATWIRRTFNFDPPDELLSKCYQESQEDEDINEDVSFLSIKTTGSTNDASRVQLHFHDADMSVVHANFSDDAVATLVSLNKSSGAVQIGIVTSLLIFIDQIASSAAVHLNSAQAIHDKHICLEPLKNTVYSDNDCSCLTYIHQLEDLVLALTFEMVRRDLKETVVYLGLLDSSISELNRLLQAVQLHLEDRGILRDDTELSSVSKEGNNLNESTFNRRHDKYLSETAQLLKSSVEEMPNIFDVQPKTLVYTFLAWAKLANKDDHLKDTVTPYQSITKNLIKIEECVDIPDEFWPISFDEAMSLTTTGKAFFPDPDLFPSNIERWRDLCFKMLATALDKFREITNTKISDTKTILSGSLVISQAYSGSREQSLAKTSVGYTEGLCSILCYLTEQLIPADRLHVSKSDIKLLKDNLLAVNNTVEKFKRRLETAEKVLINSLSLNMASVEHKQLPQFLSALPLDKGYLKSHDLEEVGPIRTPTTTTKNGKSKMHCTFGDGNSDNAPNHLYSFTANEQPNHGNYVELQWDSNSNGRHKVFCKSHGYGDSVWLPFSLLHISGQLQLIHCLIDELRQEFSKSTILMKDAKADIICAKELLVQTWKGIRKDCKKRVLPGSATVVLLKLYRHQVATAVVNMKVIRKTTGEVQYLLAQSLQHISHWLHQRPVGEVNSKGVPKGSNAVTMIKDLSFSVMLKAPVVTQNWLMTDEAKINDQVASEEATVQMLQEAHNKNICELKKAVEATSSTSIFLDEKHSKSHKPQVDTDSSASSKVMNAAKLSLNGCIKENGVITRGNEEFSSVVTSIQNLILSGLVESVAILKQPNCLAFAPTSPDGEKPEVTNLMGVFTTLIAVSVDIRSYKEVMPRQKETLQTQLTSLQSKISNILNKDSGLLDKTLVEVTKMIGKINALDGHFRGRFTSAGEYPPIEEILVAPIQPTLGFTAMEFVEGIAATLEGHVWTMVCGKPSVGTVMKSNKTLESHAVANIPLLSKLEVQLAIIDYLDKIMQHVQSALVTNREGIISAKALLKRRIKQIISFDYNKGVLGLKRWRRDNISIGKSEVEVVLDSLAVILCACTKAQENLSYISNLISWAKDILQQVVVYINLRFKLETTVGSPREESDGIAWVKTWQTTDKITGLSTMHTQKIHKKTAKRSQRQQVNLMKYKDVWENRILELELFFDYLCKKHHISVDIPIALAPSLLTSATNE